MIINNYTNVDIKVIGKTNYVLTLNYRLASCQINLKKVRGKWNYKIKKDKIIWDFIYTDLVYGKTFGYRLNPKFASGYIIDKIIIPKVEEFVRDREIESILLT